MTPITGTELQHQRMSDLAELVRAVSEGQVDTARTILDRTPSLASTQHKGASPLHYAAIHNQREAVDLLIDRGASLEDLDTEYGAAPIGWANEKGHMEMVRYLHSRGAQVTIHTASAFGLLDDVRRLAPTDRDQLNAIIGYGAPLHLACLWGHADVVRALLDAGADPTERNPDGDLPLMIAARQARTNACQTPIVLDERRREIIAGCIQCEAILRPVTAVPH
jgi:uncharacterized protein